MFIVTENIMKRPVYVSVFLYALSKKCEKKATISKEQFGSHWTDFHEIWYLKNNRETSSFIQVVK